MKIKYDPEADISKEQEFINKSRMFLGETNNSNGFYPHRIEGCL